MTDPMQTEREAFEQVVDDVFWLYELTKDEGIYQGMRGPHAERIVKQIASEFPEAGEPFSLSGPASELRSLRDSLTLAKARIAELEGALAMLNDAYCSAMRSEFDFPGRPWTPERDNDEAALRACAALKDSLAGRQCAEGLQPAAGGSPAPTPVLPSDYVNAAGIGANDSPHIVVQKLDAAARAALKEKGE
jgi:hypothetical protein